MTTWISRGLVVLAVAAVPAAAGAQVTVKPVRPTALSPSKPVLSPSQRRLPTSTVRPVMPKATSDAYRSSARASVNDLAPVQQQRPSLASVARVTRTPSVKPQQPAVRVQPPLRVAGAHE
jgi:hypothetical protein